MRFLAFIFVSVFALTSFKSAMADESDVYNLIADNSELSKLVNICPSELVQPKNIEFENLTSLCGKQKNTCLKRCLAGSPNHCFGLAHEINVADESSANVYKPLYAKSCQLGLASACTNIAAVIKNDEGLAKASCYTETFSKTCALDDPWGCTMYALSLIYGEHVEKDLDKALSVMKKGSCRFGETDRACSAAIELTNEIQKGGFD